MYLIGTNRREIYTYVIHYKHFVGTMQISVNLKKIQYKKTVRKQPLIISYMSLSKIVASLTLEPWLGVVKYRIIKHYLNVSFVLDFGLLVKGNLPKLALPDGWIALNHRSGGIIYLHKPTRVCCWSRPYHIGGGSVRVTLFFLLNV